MLPPGESICNAQVWPIYFGLVYKGTETEVNVGTMAANTSRPPYFLFFSRHIDGIQHRLTDELAPKYVDLIQHYQFRAVDRTKARRLAALKVYTSMLLYLRSWHMAANTTHSGTSLPKTQRNTASQSPLPPSPFRLSSLPVALFSLGRRVVSCRNRPGAELSLQRHLSILKYKSVH